MCCECGAQGSQLCSLHMSIALLRSACSSSSAHTCRARSCLRPVTCLHAGSWSKQHSACSCRAQSTMAASEPVAKQEGLPATEDRPHPSLQDGLKERTSIKAILESPDEGVSLVGKSLCVAGWVKTGRQQGSGAYEPWAFLELNDGSTLANLQVMVFQTLADKHGGLKKFSPTGTSVMVQGEIKATPEGVKQRVEMKATDVLWLSTCDASKYPLAKKQQSMEFLREIAHLRPRTNTIGAVARIRAALAYATHAFYHDEGFIHLQAPIITASDCEGAGEMFQVTTLMSKAEEASITAAVTDEALVEH